MPSNPAGEEARRCHCRAFLRLDAGAARRRVEFFGELTSVFMFRGLESERHVLHDIEADCGVHDEALAVGRLPMAVLLGENCNVE